MRKTPALLLLFTFAVFAAVVGLSTHWLRGRLRERFIQQHAAVIQPLAQAQTHGALKELAEGGDPFVAAELLRLSLEEMDAKGPVIDVQLFDPQGFLMAEDPEEQLATALPPGDLQRASAGLASAHYHRDPEAALLFPGDEAKTNLGVPIVEVISPLRLSDSPKILAVARYLVNGADTERELTSLDRQIWKGAAGLLSVAFAILAAVFLLAFRRLDRSRRMLEESRRQVIVANHELAFAAKSSAIGSISGHLIHGLKNPLASLKSVFSNGSGERALTADEARLCRERIDTMQAMIGDLMGILRDEERGLVYDYTLDELREMLLAKASPRAARQGVNFHVREAPELKLPGRTGNLLLLMLTNLVDNAVDASRPGGAVEVSFRREEHPLEIEVRDQGQGVPEAVLPRLFTPTKSGKEHGGGIGLALAKQMARNIGAELQLKETGPGGTCFRVVFTEIAA